MAKIWFQLLNRTSMAGNTTPAHPDSRRRFDAKRHYVILAKALDGIWPVGHACAVLY